MKAKNSTRLKKKEKMLNKEWIFTNQSQIDHCYDTSLC